MRLFLYELTCTLDSNIKMKSNAQIITEFYSAFEQMDAETMVALYAEDVNFEDPAFGKLSGKQAKDMWRMLCGNATDLSLTFEILEESENWVKAHWEANYTFSKTGRRIHNKIDATLILKDGEIIDHKDHFNLWVWSQQALGTAGWLMGWSGLFRKKLQNQTGKLLADYMAKH